jgi:hypothetical protein
LPQLKRFVPTRSSNDAPPAATGGASEGLPHAHGFKALRTPIARLALLLTRPLQRLIAAITLWRLFGAGTLPVRLMAIRRSIPLLGRTAVLMVLSARLFSALVGTMPLIAPLATFLPHAGMRMLTTFAVWAMPALFPRSIVPAMRAI